VTRAEIDDGVPPGTTTDGAARIAEPENRELRRANGISKTASAFFAQAEFERRPK
jgi:transposase